MVCNRCGAEIPKGAKVCGGCGLLKQKPSLLSTCLTSAIAAFLLLFLLFLLGIIDPFLIARNKSIYTGCLQSMQALSKGLQSYQTENGDFNKLPQTGGNGDEICNHITPGYDHAEDCFGKVPIKMKETCLDYKIDVNKPSAFQYEITGHSNEKRQCGICVTEAGYCPQKYSGIEAANSPCKNSCADAGMNSTAVCPH